MRLLNYLIIVSPCVCVIALIVASKRCKVFIFTTECILRYVGNCNDFITLAKPNRESHLRLLTHYYLSSVMSEARKTEEP